VTIIEIRPFRNSWQVYEAPGVQPYSPEKGEIRVLKSNGTVARIIPSNVICKVVNVTSVMRV
jgi:hypothetical protein